MLRDEIFQIRESILAGRYPNEAAVSQGIVLRLLNALSWPTYDVRVVAPEYGLEGRRVDYALCHPADKPIAFIEVKQVGKGDGGERQLFEYAFHLGVPIAILTDGQEWNFFLPAEQGDYGERRVYKLDLVERDLDESASRLSRYLSYQDVCSGEAIDAARADYRNVARRRDVDRALPEAWRKLIDEEDDLLLELIADRVESLCGYKPDPDTVAAFLKTRTGRPSEGGTPASAPAVVVGSSQRERRRKVTGAATGGAFGFVLFGQEHPTRSARDVLIGVLEELSKADPSFMERFASLPKHGRTRRYVARDRNDLYADRPDLVANHSHQLSSGWWVGTNISRMQVERIVRMACGVAGLKFGRDLVLRLGG